MWANERKSGEQREKHLLLYTRLREGVRETRLYRLSAGLNWGRKGKQLSVLLRMCEASSPAAAEGAAARAASLAADGHPPPLGPRQVSGLVPTMPGFPGLYTPSADTSACWALPSCRPAGLSGVEKHQGALPASSSGARKGPGHTLLGETPGTFALRGMMA